MNCYIKITSFAIYLKSKLSPILLVLFLLLFMSCNKELTDESQNTKDFFITASFGRYQIYPRGDNNIICTGDTTKESIHLNFRIVFHNESNDTVAFKSMSCSYDAEFRSSATNFLICPSICFANFPMTILIPPKHKIDRILSVIWENSSEEDVKLSFGYVPSKLLNNELPFDTLWTEPQTMNLKRLNQNVYKN